MSGGPARCGAASTRLSNPMISKIAQVITHALISAGVVFDTGISGHVLGVGQRLGRNRSGVRMVAGVKDEIALASRRDHPELSELTKVLRNGRGRRSDVLGEIVDRVLAVEQRPEDSESGFHRHRLQQFNRRCEGLLRGVRIYFSGHADRLPELDVAVGSSLQQSLYCFRMPTLVDVRLDALARLGRALADPTRCRLLLALLDGPAYPSELATKLELTRANTSNHLACLRGCGIVLAEPEGRQVRYSLVDANLAHALADLADVVLAADADECLVDLRRTSEAVS